MLYQMPVFLRVLPGQTLPQLFVMFADILLRSLRQLRHSLGQFGAHMLDLLFQRVQLAALQFALLGHFLQIHFHIIQQELFVKKPDAAPAAPLLRFRQGQAGLRGKLEKALPHSIEWLMEQGYTFKVFSPPPTEGGKPDPS